MRNKLERQEVQVPTNEDWYPTFPDNTVKVSFSGLTNGQWRVAVWGLDDHGLEHDYETRADAISMFRRVSKMSHITHEQLFSWGFINA